jgi:co-chaperonin GroES (HSP10)
MIVEIQSIKGRLRPLKGQIFVADIEAGIKMVNGIIIPDDNGNTSGIRPRWGRVVAVGEDVAVVPGQYVLIEHGRWTWGLQVVADGERKKLHAVDPQGLLVVSDENPLAA